MPRRAPASARSPSPSSIRPRRRNGRDEYYDIIKCDECVPIGHAVNANIAMVTGFWCTRTQAEARAPRLEGFQFFGYALGHYYIYGQHLPGATDVWEQFEAAPDSCRRPAGQRHRHAGAADRAAAAVPGCRRRPGGVHPAGRPQQARAHLRALELFAAQVMPALKADQAGARARKQAELAPFIAAALKRKQRMAPVAPAEFRRSRPTAATSCRPTSLPRARPHHIAADIAVMMTDVAEKKKQQVAE